MNYLDMWGISRVSNFKGKPSFWQVRHIGTGDFITNCRGKPKRFTSEKAAVWAAQHETRLGAMQELCACAYQFAGMHDAPVEWLDALSNAANGQPFTTDNLLPYQPDSVMDTERELQKVRSLLRHWFDNSITSDVAREINAYFAAIDRLNREFETS